MMNPLRLKITVAVLAVVILCSCDRKTAVADQGDNTIRLSLPALNWAVEVPLEGFTIEENSLRPDGEARTIFCVHDHTGFRMSVYVERTPLVGDSKVCRDYYWSKLIEGPIEQSDVSMTESGEMAITEYMIEEYKGIQIHQKNLNAYLAKDDIWIDVHLSKDQFEPGDEELFAPVLASIRIVDDYAPDVHTLFLYASTFFINKDYVGAAEYYQIAIDLDKKQQVMPREVWIVSVDNLGMAYGHSGDLEKSRDTYLYGISKEGEYPMFYYDLACTYAEMDDLRNTLDNIRLAYKYKDNMLRGEHMPNPRTDPSFKRFMYREELLRVLEQLGI